MRPLVFLAFLLLINNVEAGERLGFKEFLLGDSLSALTSGQRDNCVPDVQGPDTQQCTLTGYTIANQRIYGLTLSYYKNKLYEIYIWIKPNEYDVAMLALVHKYGPGKRAESIVQNNFGVKFKQTEWNWDLGRYGIQSERYKDSVDESFIYFIDNKISDEQFRSSHGQIKSPDEDL